MKRIFVTVLLITVMIFSITACKNGENTDKAKEETSESTAQLPEKNTDENNTEPMPTERAPLPEASRPYTISEIGRLGGNGEDGIVLYHHVKDSVNTSGVEIPDEAFLYDFLLRYKLFLGSDFDSEDPSESNIVMGIAADDLINDSVYELGEYKEYKEEEDPRGWGETGVTISDRKAVDWLATNIFNLTEKDIKKMVSKAEEQRILYAKGDKYYGFVNRTGLSAVLGVEIKECKNDGNVYWLAFDYLGGETIYAKTEYKTIDDIGYWTLRSYSEKRPEDMPE